MKPQGRTSRKKARSSAVRLWPWQPRMQARNYFTRQVWPSAFSEAQKVWASALEPKPPM